MPMRPRKKISISAVDANAQAAEAIAKITRPMMRIFLRPYLSPSTPQVNSSEANTRM